MRKIIICSLLFFVIFNNLAAADSTENDEFLQLTSIISGLPLNITDWQVTIKEQMEMEELEEIVNDLRNSYKVTMKEDENSLKYSFSENDEGMTVSYTAIIPKHTGFQAELIGVLKGKDWNSSVKDSYRQKTAQMYSRFFTKYAETFTCLITDHGVIMNDDYVLKKVLDDLAIRQIQTQTDSIENVSHKKMIYGYTPLLGENILINKKPINLQIVIDNEKITFGTPILINEY